MANKRIPLRLRLPHKIITLFTPKFSHASTTPPRVGKQKHSGGIVRFPFIPVKKDPFLTLLYDHAIPLQLAPS
jgi:hypothetical protein